VSTPIDLHPAAGRLARIIEEVPDDSLADPTPCAEYTVGALLDHLDGTVVAFHAAAVKDPLPGGPSGDAAKLQPGWRSRIPDGLGALAEAWDDPEAWTGRTAAGGVELPGGVAGVVALDELVIHGWDLATATGQLADYDGPGLEAVHGFVTDVRNRGIEGLFGPEVAVPADATLFERILGATGRDPHWRPRTR